MKRISIMIIGLLACQIMAAPLSQEVAIARAQAWMGSNVLMKQSPRSIGSVTRFPETNSTYFVYVVTLSPSGYLVLNSDDRLPLIFSFSAQSSLNLLDDPLNTFRFLLDNHIEKVEEWMESPDDFPQAASPDPLAVTELIEPLLETAWGQSNPYNKLCPTNSAGTRAPSGCVATAFAQIINYHSWPPNGFGISTYTDNMQTLQNTHWVDLSDPYDWKSMLNYYTPLGFTEANADAVAELMYEIGVLFKLNYEPTETGGYAQYFSSPPFASLYYEKAIYGFPSKTPIGVLESDLRAGFPVQVNLSSMRHAFITDGLMTDAGVTTYHLDYGWEGVNNGWFDATAMSSWVTKIRPTLLAFPQTNEVRSVANSSIALTSKIPRRREGEVKKIGVYEEKKQGGLWQSDASSFSKNPRGWVIDPNGRSGTCWRTDAREYCNVILREVFVPDASSDLTFWLRSMLNPKMNQIFLKVLASTDDGVTFSEIFHWDVIVAANWHKRTASLSAYAGQRIQLQFFLYDDMYDSHATTDGLWLDDLSVTSGEWYDFELFHETTSFTSERYSENNTLLFDGSDFSGMTLDPASGADAWGISQTNGVEHCFVKLPDATGSFHLALIKAW